LGGRLGLLQDDPQRYLKSAGGVAEGPDDAAIEALVSERSAARKGGDWGRADEIRDQLVALGIELLDGAGQTTWRRK
jgi:cysteinyl-tRNA synthetase